MKTKLKKMHCVNCGAPVTTEICPYCNSTTGLDTNHADMEYPVIECKEASLSFWAVAFPMIFACAFGFAGFIMPILFFAIGGDFFPKAMILMFLPFAIIGVGAFIIGVKPLIRYMIINSQGKEINAIVYGYMDDNIYFNGNPGQIVKLLVDSSDGKKFILYQLGDIKQPFKINSTLKLKVYKDIFLIENKKQYYF